jgi:hypothetical protein
LYPTYYKMQTPSDETAPALHSAAPCACLAWRRAGVGPGMCAHRERLD